MSTRLETLQAMLQQDPKNTFARYALATEYKNSGDLDLAIAEFHALIENDPKYHAAYYHGGQTLERAGRRDEARDLYRQGVDVTIAAGDDHARAEMQAALDSVG